VRIRATTIREIRFAARCDHNRRAARGRDLSGRQAIPLDAPVMTMT
jgi:hypothetical protein